jgi:hypothetical protein
VHGVASQYEPGGGRDENPHAVAALAIAAVPALALSPNTGSAAHAGAPYRDVDRSNDTGNDTGDARVEGLNDQQRDEDYRGPLELRAPASHPPTAQTPPAYAPR